MRPLVFLVLSLLGTPLLTTGAQAADSVDSFLQSKWTYCDAKVFAGKWSSSIWDAKARIGRKVAAGADHILDDQRLDAGLAADDSPQTACHFSETEMSMKDAELLAGAWNLTRNEAKSRLALKATRMGEAEVQRAVLAPLRGSTSHAGPTTAAGMDSCHTKMLRHLWGASEAEVQATVQRKLSIGQGTYIQAEIEHARKLANLSDRVACSFFDTPYTYRDAELLGARWRQGVSEAKTTIARKYKFGMEDWLASELASAGGGSR